MFGDLTLVEHDILSGIDAAGEECRGDLADRERQFARILPDGDGVQVDDAVDAIKTILQLDKALDGAEIIAEMEIASRLHAGKNQLLEFHDWQRPR